MCILSPLPFVMVVQIPACAVHALWSSSSACLLSAVKWTELC